MDYSERRSMVEYLTTKHPYLINKQEILVGYTLYGASVMRKRIWKEYGTIIISPPFPKQNKKISTPWQNTLLNMRSKIESVFDYLKNHLHLVSSFPRSMSGYLIHYLSVLVSYQIMALMKGQGVFGFKVYHIDIKTNIPYDVEI